MIVVAIIGILAAVAIPGFMQYIKSSKTSEAKDNLKAIADGAISYFEAEHPKTADGMKIFTKQYPHCGDQTPPDTGEATLTGCTAEDNPLGETPTASTVGTKFSPNDYLTAADGKSDSGFNAKPWVALKFRISKPFYYQYTYASKITAAAEGAAAATSAGFVAGASASLSEEADSNYKIVGSPQGTVGNIVELEEGTAYSADF